MRRRSANNPNERGAVLLTTMLLMSVMAVLAIGIMADIHLSLNRVVAVQNRVQAQWYVRGGESYATLMLGKLAKDAPRFHAAIAEGQRLDFPIENGVIRLSLADGGNCYNLNALALKKGRKNRQARLIRLFEILEIDPADAETLVAKITDWVDSDDIPETGGAEDLTYSNKTPPYHPANRPIIDISELRAIDGLDEPTYQKIQPLVCALPNKKLSKLNINTLDQKGWPLLALAFGGTAQAQAAAQSVIAKRPANGYESVGDVWQRPEVRALELKGSGQSMVSTKSKYVIVNVEVQTGINDPEHALTIHEKILYDMNGPRRLAIRDAF